MCSSCILSTFAEQEFVDRRRIGLYLLCVRTPGHPVCRREWVQQMDGCILITVELRFAFFSIEFLFCVFFCFF